LQDEGTFPKTGIGNRALWAIKLPSTAFFKTTGAKLYILAWINNNLVCILSITPGEITSVEWNVQNGALGWTQGQFPQPFLIILYIKMMDRADLGDQLLSYDWTKSWFVSWILRISKYSLRFNGDMSSFCMNIGILGIWRFRCQICIIFQ
jgi:hypothetical protein